jgi:hypothetical protein
MLTCGICGGKATSPVMCAACGRSWDRARNRDDGSVGAAMTWASKRARRFERMRVRDELNAQGHEWTHLMLGSSSASYVTCVRCGVTFLAVTDLSRGRIELRLCGVGGTHGIVGRTGKMPQCPSKEEVRRG